MGHPSQAFYDAIAKHFSKSEQKQLFVKIDDILPYIEDDEQIFPENFRKIGLYRAKERELVIIKNPDVPSDEWITARFAKKEVFRDLTKTHDFKLIVFHNIDFTEAFFDFTEGYFEHFSDGVSLCFINCKIESFPPEFFSIKYSELEFRDSEINHMVFSSLRARDFYINDTIIHELNSTDGISCDVFSIEITKKLLHSMEEYMTKLFLGLKLETKREIHIYISNSIMNTFSPQFCRLLLNSFEPREVLSKNIFSRISFNSSKRLYDNTVEFQVLNQYNYEPRPIDDVKYRYIYWVPYSDKTKFEKNSNSNSNSILINLTGIEVDHKVLIKFRLIDITEVPLKIEYFKNLYGINFDSDIRNFSDINVSAFKNLNSFRSISITEGAKSSIDRFNIEALNDLQIIQDFIKTNEFRTLNIDINNINQSFILFKKYLSINYKSILSKDYTLIELLKPELINVDIVLNLRRLVANKKLSLKINDDLIDFLYKIRIEYPISKFDFDVNTIIIFFK
jgi:hypothetical protein